MYNLEVDGDHCYRVGEQGILVHNASAKCPCSFGPAEGFPEVFSAGPSTFKMYRDLDTMSRPVGIRARLNKSTIQGGSDASVDPPGWDDRVNRIHGNIVSRGHLLAQVLGGDGSLQRNIVSVCQRTTNSQMESVERRVKKKIVELEVATVDFEVEALYRGADKIPYAIRMRAIAIESPTSEYCWTDLLNDYWNNPIPNEVNPYKCPGGI